MQPKDALVLDL